MPAQGIGSNDKQGKSTRSSSGRLRSVRPSIFDNDDDSLAVGLARARTQPNPTLISSHPHHPPTKLKTPRFLLLQKPTPHQNKPKQTKTKQTSSHQHCAQQRVQTTSRPHRPSVPPSPHPLNPHSVYLSATLHTPRISLHKESPSAREEKKAFRP